MLKRQAAELLGVEQGADHPFLIVEVAPQPFRMALHRQLQRLAGAEGQGHRGAAGAP